MLGCAKYNMHILFAHNHNWICMNLKQPPIIVGRKDIIWHTTLNSYLELDSTKPKEKRIITSLFLHCQCSIEFRSFLLILQFWLSFWKPTCIGRIEWWRAQVVEEIFSCNYLIEIFNYYVIIVFLIGRKVIHVLLRKTGSLVLSYHQTIFSQHK